MRKLLGLIIVVSLSGILLGASYFSIGMYFGKDEETGNIVTDFVAQVDLDFFTVMGYLKGSEDELHGGDVYAGANVKVPLGSIYGRAEALVSLKGMMRIFDAGKAFIDVPILTKLGIGVAKKSFSVEFGASGLNYVNENNSREFIPIYKTYSLLGMTF